jgi:homocysteine S-methyltransferase
LLGAQQAGKPVWLSVSVHDRDGTKLRSGEPAAGLRDVLAAAPAAAVLANCSMPEAMLAALVELKGLGLPFGAYANGFSEISSLPLPDSGAAPDYTHRHDLTPEKYADFAMQWVALGATIVGGCCEVGPAHIRHLAQRLRAEGHTIA